MLKYTAFFILFFLCITGCIERYEFKIENKTDGLVIESSISNISFTGTKAYPSDGRYFKVRLARVSDVINIRDEAITGATVEVFNDQEQSWRYTENPDKPGEYFLYDTEFKAFWNTKYQLRVRLETGEEFQSSWEQMPARSTKAGTVSFEETIQQRYVYRKRDEKILTDFNGININISVPENEDENPLYYRWNFEPLWVYVAPEAVTAFVEICWVTSPYYLRNHTIHKDLFGNYDKEIFFLETTGNNRVYLYFSVLITQSVISEDYYHFWEDLQAQAQTGGLFDQAPFNVPTNFTAVNNSWNVNGYFGVVTEDATRWVLNKLDLSYGIENDVLELCLIDYGPAVPGELNDCESCLEYTRGDSKNRPPDWW